MLQAEPLPLPHFDRQQLLNELAATRSPLPVLRALLRRLQDESFAYFRATLDAQTLVFHRASMMDQLLQCLWQHLALPNQGLCLLAVGGFGRGELHPYSDIDVLLLCQDEAQLSQYADQLQRFITLLWDLKLEVGHSVRTLSECDSEARKDLTIITNLMESRALAGDVALHSTLQALIAPSKMWDAASYFYAKWEELRARHKKHNDSEYNLEPNVKNSPGAMRDIQTINWATMRYFGSSTLEALLERKFLTQAEYDRLRRSLSFLWQVRFALHMLSNREEDRLLFDLQRQVAELLGFKDSKGQLGVELFMARFYRHQLAIIELCDLLLLHFNEDFMRADPLCIEPLNEHFQLANGFLQMRADDLFAREPKWLLEIFVLLARTPNVKGVHSNTIRALREHRHLIDHQFRQNKTHNAIFMQLLSSPKWVMRELKRMMRYGILGLYIPEFGRIIGMMEHDLFHIYTVDEHSLRMLRLLRKLRIEDLSEQFALAGNLIHSLDKKQVLYLTALLHDTGKGRPGNHAENSAKIAKSFCRQHSVSPEDRQLIEWLCAQHLLMSKASQRLELNNPDDIHNFARKVGNIERLNYLYVISIADIYSTNPKHWTCWRAEQINTLYRHTVQALQRGLDRPLSRAEHIERTQKKAIELLAQEGLNEAQVRAIWGSANDDYFIRESVRDIVWHTQSIFSHRGKTPLVAIRPTSTAPNEGATQIFIFMQDQINLFAATTATLDQLNLNIQDARIMTSELERNVVDTYVVLDENNLPVTNPERLEQIKKTLTQVLANPENYSTTINRRTPRALKQFKVETQVTMSTDPLLRCTKLEVIAADRPGLLARMGAIFSQHGAQIQAAKILTEGEQIADIFYLLNRQGEPYGDVQECLALKEALVAGLNEQVATQSAF